MQRFGDDTFYIRRFLNSRCCFCCVLVVDCLSECMVFCVLLLNGKTKRYKAIRFFFSFLSAKRSLKFKSCVIYAFYIITADSCYDRISTSIYIPFILSFSFSRSYRDFCIVIIYYWCWCWCCCCYRYRLGISLIPVNCYVNILANIIEKDSSV